MNSKELANKLVGATYDNFVSDDVLLNNKLADEAKQNGLVVVFGASDDLMEFRGAINYEIGAYDGTTAYLTSTGLLLNDCDNDYCPHFEKLTASAATILALWRQEGEYSWTFKTDIPHETFEITDRGDQYCRGIVFALADLGVEKNLPERIVESKK